MQTQQAKKITLAKQSIWQGSAYVNFLNQCSREELLQSQTPFYEAVAAFPRLLLKLASCIRDENARHLVVENIWEEHGQGDKSKFHTQSFIRHLNSLGFNGQFFNNPFVSDWLKQLFAIECTKTLFHTLAAIEYLYAVISDSIAQRLQNLPLLTPAEHYQKHSAIDWTHGEELLSAMLQEGIDFDAGLFENAQNDFLTLFNRLSLVALKEVNTFVAHNPIAFVHSRESTQVIDATLATLATDKLKVLCVCSGGENPIYYAAHSNVAQVVAFDINAAQLQLCQDKMHNQFKPETQGRFEFLFGKVRSYFTHLDGRNTIVLDALKNPQWLAWVIDNTFTNEVLATLFTDEAVKYTRQSFSEHFKQVYFDLCRQVAAGNGDPQTLNLLYGQPIKISKKQCAQAINKVDLWHTPVHAAVANGSFDVIDLSNIGDWMPKLEFSQLLSAATKALNPGGKLVLRRLLGDYSLLEFNFKSVQTVHDDTEFYLETVLVTP